jgi:hypothetical protein
LIAHTQREIAHTQREISHAYKDLSLRILNYVTQIEPHHQRRFTVVSLEMVGFIGRYTGTMCLGYQHLSIMVNWNQRNLTGEVKYTTVGSITASARIRQLTYVYSISELACCEWCHILSSRHYWAKHRIFGGHSKLQPRAAPGTNGCKETGDIQRVGRGVGRFNIVPNTTANN